jgi:hypothetical protein
MNGDLKLNQTVSSIFVLINTHSFNILLIIVKIIIILYKI